MKPRLNFLNLSTLCLILLMTSSSQAYETTSPKIALIQYNADASFGDVKKHLSELSLFAEKAAQSGAKIIVLPEGAIYGYADSRQLWCSPQTTECQKRQCVDVSQIAESGSLDETIGKFWFEFALKNNVYILYNMPEVNSGIYYNTTFAMGPKGLAAKYRKRTLYYLDKCYASQGDSETILETQYGRFGLLTCADANIPALVTSYAKSSVNAVIISMDWDQDPTERERARPACLFFQNLANQTSMDIYAADVSPWDGTGKYPQKAKVRERNGLPTLEVTQDGVSLHELD